MPKVETSLTLNRGKSSNNVQQLFSRYVSNLIGTDIKTNYAMSRRKREAPNHMRIVKKLVRVEPVHRNVQAENAEASEKTVVKRIRPRRKLVIKKKKRKLENAATKPFRRRVVITKKRLITKSEDVVKTALPEVTNVMEITTTKSPVIEEEPTTINTDEESVSTTPFSIEEIEASTNKEDEEEINNSEEEEYNREMEEETDNEEVSEVEEENKMKEAEETVINEGKEEAEEGADIIQKEKDNPKSKEIEVGEQNKVSKEIKDNEQGNETQAQTDPTINSIFPENILEDEEPTTQIYQNVPDYEPSFPELSLDAPIQILRTTVISSIDLQTKTVVQSRLRTYTFLITRVNGDEQIITSTTEVKPHTKTIVVTEPFTRYTTLTLVNLDPTETQPLLPITNNPVDPSSQRNSDIRGESRAVVNFFYYYFYFLYKTLQYLSNTESCVKFRCTETV